MNITGVRNIYLLGDLHIGIKNNSNEWFDIQRDFLLDWFLSELDKSGFDPEVDVLFQAGDWNHVRESTNVRISNASLEIFETLSKKFKKGIHIILGNHDVYYKDRTDVHSLKIIDKLFDNVHIYESPEVITINGKHRFLMLPWEHDVSKLSKTVSLNKNKADYILCHADIKDFKLNKWTKLDHGLSRSDLSDFKKIFSGHIHIRQEFNNIVYLGTPYQLDRGDHGNTKGYYVLNAEGADIIDEFYPNTRSPLFVKHQALDILNTSLDKVKEMFSGNYVDILIDNNLAKVFPITQFIELVKNSGARLIEFYPYSSEKSEDIELDSSTSYEYNIFEVLGEYMKAREIPERMSSKISSKFKEIHDDLKNSKNNYE